jgi:hypothetical protein
MSGRSGSRRLGCQLYNHFVAGIENRSNGNLVINYLARSGRAQDEMGDIGGPAG